MGTEEHKITKHTVAAAVYTGSVESAAYQTDLEDKVNALIEEGRQPFGSLQRVQRETWLVALQPMVRSGAEGGVSRSILRQVEAGIHASQGIPAEAAKASPPPNDSPSELLRGGSTPNSHVALAS